MYWAYLHKTSLVAELMLTRILKRAKELTVKGSDFTLRTHATAMDTLMMLLDLFAQLT
jgi:HD superfamily phosphohydrolase